MAPIYLPIEVVLRLANPVVESPWPGERVTIAAVEAALQERRLRSRTVIDRECARDHAERIAYFVEQGWVAPVRIDLGIPEVCGLPDWSIPDGNHRTFAAFVRGDRGLLAIIEGSAAAVLALRRFGASDPGELPFDVLAHFRHRARHGTLAVA